MSKVKEKKNTGIIIKSTEIKGLTMQTQKSFFKDSYSFINIQNFSIKTLADLLIYLTEVYTTEPDTFYVC